MTVGEWMKYKRKRYRYLQRIHTLGVIVMWLRDLLEEVTDLLNCLYIRKIEETIFKEHK